MRHSYSMTLHNGPVLELTPVQAIQARPTRCRRKCKKLSKVRVTGRSQGRKQTVRDQEKSWTRQVPKRRKGPKTTMEGRCEGETEGQLGPYGSGRSPNSTTPHQTSGKTEERRTMLPLRSPGAHV